MANPDDLISIPKRTGKELLSLLRWARSELGWQDKTEELTQCNEAIEELEAVVNSDCKCEGYKRLSCDDASCQYWHYLDCATCKTTDD